MIMSEEYSISHRPRLSQYYSHDQDEGRDSTSACSRPLCGPLDMTLANASMADNLSHQDNELQRNSLHSSGVKARMRLRYAVYYYHLVHVLA